MPKTDSPSLLRTGRDLLAMVAAAGLMSIASGCKRSNAAAHAPPGGPPAALVTVTEVVTRDVPVYLDQIGKCSAFRMVSIKPQVSGKIIKILFTDGQDVKTGKVLFEIDPAPYKAQLAQATAQLSQSNAQLGFANVDFNRVKDLPRSVEPQSDVDAKQNASPIP